MKACPRCGRTLEASEFNVKDRSTGRLQVYCRECSRGYVREHYRRNTAYYTTKARKRNKLVRSETRERLMAYLQEHPCIDCGETDPIVLQFDHVDAKTKQREVSLLMQNYSSWAVIEAEMAKCEVR